MSALQARLGTVGRSPAYLPAERRPNATIKGQAVAGSFLEKIDDETFSWQLLL